MTLYLDSLVLLNSSKSFSNHACEVRENIFFFLPLSTSDRLQLLRHVNKKLCLFLYLYFDIIINCLVLFLLSFLVDKNMRTKGEIRSRVQLLLMNIAIESTIC